MIVPMSQSGRLAGRQRGAQRGVPLLIAVAAMSVAIGVFPDALHSALSGPGRQAAIQPSAQAGVTHEGDVPPFNLGKRGAGATGPGTGSGQNRNAPAGGELGGGSGGAVGAGFGRGGGSGPGGGPGGDSGIGGGPGGGAGIGGGPGGGAGTGPNPPSLPNSGSDGGCGVDCGGGTGRNGGPGGGGGTGAGPRIPLCYSNSLGPDSQTTEDPLSPPCVSWDGTPGRDDPDHGVRANEIDVYVVNTAFPGNGAELRLDAAVLCSDGTVPPPPTGAPGAFTTGDYSLKRTWSMLCHFMQTRLQTYGRVVRLLPYNDDNHLVGEALAQDLAAQTPRPFAVLTLGLYEANPYFAKFGIEDFSLGIGLDGVGGPVDPSYYWNTFLDGAYDGTPNGGTVKDGVPFAWSVRPTLDDLIGNGAAWVCQSVVGKAPINANDPTLVTKPVRKIALGYETVSGFAGQTGDPSQWQQDLAASKALADRFAHETDRRCGQGGHVFDTFGSEEDVWVDNWAVAGPGDITPDALACMRHVAADNHACRNNLVSVDALGNPISPDTSLLCLLCGLFDGYDYDHFAADEQSAQYLPEFMFVGDLLADPFWAADRDAAAFNKAFGIRETWQLPGFLHTYWYRAYQAVDPTGVVSQGAGFAIYELLLQLFAAIHLAGPNLDAAHVAGGETARGPTYVGLYGWQRRATFSADAASPPASPAAGYTPAHHAFLVGMIEERWDSAATPPDGAFVTSQSASRQGGCYRIIDHLRRFGVEPDPAHNVSEWPKTDDSGELAPPCTGDDVANVYIGPG